MRPAFTRLDLWLLVMTVIWGSNFTVIKAALRELPELGFNALRLLIASAVFLVLIALREGVGGPLRRISRRDWLWMLALAFVGHFLYQFCFLGGVARTSVANAALIFGCTPVAVGLLSSAVGHDRLGWTRWAGALLSIAGIALVVGTGSRTEGASPTGDLLILSGMLSWTVYTVASRPLLERHSPLLLTGLTMTMGSLLYAPFGWPSLSRVSLAEISAGAWAALGFSSVFALVVAYLIWYTAVQRVGGAHTSIYANVTPLVAMLVAALVLGEPLTLVKIVGAAAILGGVALTRLPLVPAES